MPRSAAIIVFAVFGIEFSVQLKPATVSPADLLRALRAGPLLLAFAGLSTYRRKHGRISCLAMFGCGLDSRGVAPEVVVAGVGAGLVAGAHLLNLRLCHRCRCRGQNCE